MDFTVGQTFTRDGLVSEFTYAGNSAGPSPGGSAVDTPLVGGVPWNAPANALVNDGLYANVDLISASTSTSDMATISQGSSGSQWTNPSNLTSPTASTFVSLGGTTTPGTGSQTAKSGTVTQGASGAQWQQLQYLFANPESMSVSLGGTSGTTTTTYPGSPANSSLTSVADSSNPVVTQTVVSSFATSPVYGNITVNCNVSASFSGTTTGGGSVQIQYSKDGGATWSEGYGVSASTGTTPVSFTVTGVSNTSNFRVQLFVLAAWGTGGSISVFGQMQSLQIVFATTGTENPVQSANANAGSLGLSLPSGATFSGLAVSFEGIASGALATLAIQLTVSGVLIGTAANITMSATTTTYNLTATGLGISSLSAAQVAALGCQISASVGTSAPTTLVALLKFSLTVNYSTSATAGPTSSSLLTGVSFGVALPPNTTYTNVSIGLKGLYAGAAASVAVRLTSLGVPIGTAQVINLTTGSTHSTFSSFGVSSLTATQIATLGIQVSAGVVAGSATTTVTLNDLSLTLSYTGPSMSDALDITQFGFSVPPGTSPIGFSLAITGYASSTAAVQVQMLKADQTAGVAAAVPLKTTSGIVPVGANNDLFSSTWNYNDLNGTGFGMRITASGSGNVYIGYVTITVYFAPTQANFDYVTTFEDSFGDIYTLALDAAGTFWIEDVIHAPGVFNALFSGPPVNSFATGFNADSRIYLAISDLLSGNYPPQQYTGQWRDRISQVGPGAPPSFTGTLQSGSVATITAYSVSSNVVSLTISPALGTPFTAGEVVNFNITSGPVFLNGTPFSVLGTGLTTSSFQVAYATANASGSAVGTASPQYTYPIVASPNGITQYPPYPVVGSVAGQFDEITLSAGPGTLNAGNVVTCYYAVSGPDTILVNAFQSGKFPVYVYISGAPVGNGTQLLTSVGLATPPGLDHERFYFTFNIATTGKINYGNPSPGTYQMTVATLTTQLPLPGVQVGDQVTITGNGVTSWNARWAIVTALNSGTYQVSNTQMTAGVATYNWQLSGTTSTPPIVGQLVTITGTLNGNGIFNVTDAAITAVTGTSSGTFTVAGFAGSLNYASQTEVGQATTSGTVFQIDPGPLTFGNSASPIYGNSGGGYITLVGSTSVVVSVGTRRAVCFFITRNGYYTAPSPYAQFNTVSDTNYVLVSHIPIGPPDVIARGIAFTGAGSNGVPLNNYYTIPQPVQFVLNNVTYTSSSLFINDNTTTTAKFTFTDEVLLNAEEIDIQGANLFNQYELGDAAWCTQYAGRSVWGRVRNKVLNLVNMSFDGGYNPNPGGDILPLGWSINPVYTPTSGVTLLVSPVFGNSLYIKNPGTPTAIFGLISQNAYQDQNLVPILLPNTLYSVRVTCRTPAGAQSGALVIDLSVVDPVTGASSTPGQYQLNCAQMTSSMATYQGTILTTAFTTVPSNLVLRLYGLNLPNGGDLEIDRLDIFPTIDPTNLTGLTFSYKNDLEAFDQVTGIVDTSTVNQQPANGAAIIHDQLYIFKESSMGYLSDSPNQEPSEWNEYKEVSNIAGACGINAYDIGEEWAIMACRNGLYGFNGGAPMPMMLEIPDVWNAINWNSAQSIVVRNDTENRRILIAVPLPTPNQWLPYAPVNANPMTPNVVLMMNYKGMGSIEEMMDAMSLHVTMSGKVVVQDIRRKWSIWTIPTPYLAVCKRSELDEEMLICNGINSSKIYRLDPDAATDDGVNIPWLYTTYGFVDENKAAENPMYGEHNKRFAYVDLLISGAGTCQVRFLQNTLEAQYPYLIPGGVDLKDPAYDDEEFPLDEYGMRMFVELSANTDPTLIPSAGCYVGISRITLVGAADRWAPVRGK